MVLGDNCVFLAVDDEDTAVDFVDVVNVAEPVANQRRQVLPKQVFRHCLNRCIRGHQNQTGDLVFGCQGGGWAGADGPPE